VAERRGNDAGREWWWLKQRVSIGRSRVIETVSMPIGDGKERDGYHLTLSFTLISAPLARSLSMRSSQPCLAA
jgi:hypothetical protein